MRACNRDIVPNSGGVCAELHLGFQKHSFGEDQVPRVLANQRCEATSQPVLNCELQVDGTATLACTVQDLMGVLREEFGSPCEGISFNFGREGWTLATQFSSPANLKMILDAINRVIQRESIPVDDVAIVLGDDRFPFVDLLPDCQDSAE